MIVEKELNVHRKSVEALCANDKYLFTASADHSVKVFSLMISCYSPNFVGVGIGKLQFGNCIAGSCWRSECYLSY